MHRGMVIVDTIKGGWRRMHGVRTIHSSGWQHAFNELDSQTRISNPPEEALASGLQLTMSPMLVFVLACFVRLGSSSEFVEVRSSKFQLQCTLIPIFCLKGCVNLRSVSLSHLSTKFNRFTVTFQLAVHSGKHQSHPDEPAWRRGHPRLHERPAPRLLQRGHRRLHLWFYLVGMRIFGKNHERKA